MADISDVLTVIAGVVATALYPSGTSQASALGVDCRVFPGWPTPDALRADLAAGKLNVSVYPRPTERNTTRYPTDNVEVSRNIATYTLAISGQTITVGGAAPSPYALQNLAAVINSKTYVVTALAGNSPAALAAALKALIVADIAVTTVTGAVITLPPTARIGAAQVAVSGTTSVEVGRQDREVQITFWASTPAMRDAAAKVIDPVLRAQTFLPMPDNTAARFVYKSSPFTDFDQKAGIFRRDLIYSAEYVTTVQSVAQEIISSQADVTVGT